MQGKAKLDIPSWHLLYFVLAAFSVLTVTVTLGLNHQIMKLQDETLISNRACAQLARDLGNLEHEAAHLSRPAYRVFENEDYLVETQMLRRAQTRFKAELETTREHLRQSTFLSNHGQMVLMLTEVEAQTDRTVELSREIFDDYRGGRRARAAAKLAQIDALANQSHEQVDAIETMVKDAQLVSFELQAGRAGRLHDLQYVVGALVVAGALGLAVYGHRLAMQTKRNNQKIIDASEIAIHAQRTADMANSAKTAFLANMSHEIRTPMTAIVGYSDVLLDVDANESDRLNASHTIKRNANHLLNLISDILDVSKIEAGRYEADLCKTELGPLLCNAHELMLVRSEDTGATLSTRLLGPIPGVITTDPTKLNQCLINLLSNALKFTPGGKVQMQVAYNAADRSLCFEVIDEGIGMTEEQLSKIFKPFTQADVSTTRQFGGTGLGLTITKHFVELLGGTLEVESQLGVGSVFSITLPVEHESEPEMIGSLEPYRGKNIDDQAAGVSLEGVRVLLVEDGPDNQRLIRYMLTKAGAQVMLAHNGRQGVNLAMEALRNRDMYDVVLMDMQMPIMDGYQAAAELRKRDYPGQIIALTAHALKGEIDRCLDAGCDHYLSKPIDRRVFLPTLRERAGTPSEHAMLAAA